jgi:peroxiredoxin
MMKFLKIVLSITLICTLYSCNNKEAELKVDATLRNVTCYFFFIPDCPVCINNFNKIEALKIKFESKGLTIKAIYSDTYADSLQLKRFIKDYTFTIPVTIDKELKLARQYAITTTPQVVLVDSLNTILYSGMLDNYFYALGKHRTVVSEKYLEKALESLLKGEKIVVPKTTPIGCKINFKYTYKINT